MGGTLVLAAVVGAVSPQGRFLAFVTAQVRNISAVICAQSSLYRLLAGISAQIAHLSVSLPAFMFGYSAEVDRGKALWREISNSEAAQRRRMGEKLRIDELVDLFATWR